MQNISKKIELSEIAGRGGAALTYVRSDDSSHIFLLVGGASREAQFDDFFNIIVSKTDDSVTAEKLNIIEMDGFGARHSLSAASANGKTVLFGGQDVIKQTVSNELFIYDHQKNEIEKIEYIKEGLIIPKPRNSHSFVKHGDIAFVYGGANNEGPLNDAFKLDLLKHTFSNIQIVDLNLAPYFEMGTSHIYQGNKLLLIGGRSHCLPTQIADPEAQAKIMASPFRDVVICLDLETGKIDDNFAQLPTALASHQSFLIDDKILIIYGGTNGLRFFDNVIRYDMEKKEWKLMQKYPKTQSNSGFFKDGRFGMASAEGPEENGDQTWILFGGSTVDQDMNEFLVLHKSHLMDESNFMQITEIM